MQQTMACDDEGQGTLGRSSTVQAVDIVPKQVQKTAITNANLV